MLFFSWPFSFSISHLKKSNTYTGKSSVKGVSSQTLSGLQTGPKIALSDMYTAPMYYDKKTPKIKVFMPMYTGFAPLDK
jgi:hypothetical protein